MGRPRPVERMRRAIGWIPPAGLALLAGAVLIAAGVGGAFAYRSYEYVEHDNRFCLSCHLMVQPYEAFAQSAHRGLGCKACHQPTFTERGQMALSQVLVGPEEIGAHAAVPNSVCAACHIEGDPERWRIISRSAGHRVHLESADPALQGLMCVECHSSSIHEFAATSRTCGQSGCHEDTGIGLGGMGGFTIHCVTCHDFTQPVPDSLPVRLARGRLQPGREECLTCHAMREILADLPADEPHDRVCGACHNPHAQESPRQAEETCASAGCHERADTLTPLHRGLAAGVLEGCLNCHVAHRFRAEGEDCLGCHQDIFVRPARRLGWLSRGAARSPGEGLLASLAPRVLRQAAPARRPLELSHARHREVECSACHDARESHGALTVTSVRDCRGCHHTQPVAADCAACHPTQDLGRASQPVRQTLRLSVAAPRERTLPFSHAAHGEVSCASCHREPLTLRSTASCTDCHEMHHRPSARCIDCHAAPPAGAHTASVHLGCGGAGCHDPVPAAVRDVPRVRNLCLSCHQSLVDHEPGGNCADCHQLPRPSGRAAPAPAERRGG
jgi:hypothetical protein